MLSKGVLHNVLKVAYFSLRAWGFSSVHGSFPHPTYQLGITFWSDLGTVVIICVDNIPTHMGRVSAKLK